MLTADERASVEAHLTTCPDCQASSEALKAIAALLATPPASTPSNRKLDTQLRVQAMLRRKASSLEGSHSKQNARGRVIPLVRYFAVAASVLVALGLLLQLGKSHNAAETSVEKQVLPAVEPVLQASLNNPEVEPEPLKALEPEDCLDQIRADLKALAVKAGAGGGEYDALLRRIDSLLKQIEDGREALALKKIKVAAYEGKGDVSAMREAYLAYVDAYGEFWYQGRLRLGVEDSVARMMGQKRKYSLVKSHVEELFYSQKDMLGALHFLDALQVKYRDAADTQYVQFMVGRCYDRLKSPSGAIEAFEKVVQAGAQSFYGKQAAAAIPVILFNYNGSEAALEYCRGLSKNRRLPEEVRAYSEFQEGVFLSLGNEDSKTRALVRFREVIEKFPGTRAASQSQHYVNGINKRLLNSVMDFEV
jgi:hypothetical protein